MVLMRQDHGLEDIRPWFFIQKTVVRLREDHGPITKIRIRFESFALEGASYPLLTPFLLHARPMGFWHKIIKGERPRLASEASCLPKLQVEINLESRTAQQRERDLPPPISYRTA